MLLLHLLLHVLIYHLLSAKEGPKVTSTAKAHEEQQHLYAGKPKDTNYIVKRIDNCPDVGYYFTRQPAPNSIDPGPCYLCFCHGEKTAVCWKRDNRRCNADSFYYHAVAKRDTRIALGKDPKHTRVRRSPGFADIFFRDASRDVFNKNSPDQQCKPYESSFSEDCPPADWCIGCTVCDCDPNGRWDCHILSFCPEKKKGKKKNDGGPPRKIVKKKPLPKTTPTPKMTSTNSKKMKPTVRRSNNNKPKPQKRVVKSVTPKNNNNNKKQQKKKPPLKYKKVNNSNTKTAKPTVVIKKNISTHKPILLKGNKVQSIIKNHDNHTVVIAQQVVKRVMDAVKQMVHREMRNVTRLVSGGRSEMNNTKLNNKNNKNAPKRGGKKQGRAKREVTSTDFNNFTLSRSTTTPKLQENVIESTIPTEVPEISPVVGNNLNSNIESVTFSPTLSSSTQSENEYYKYIIGTENPSNVIPLEIKPSTDNKSFKINVTDDTEINKKEVHEVKKIETNEINTVETNEMSKIDTNDIKVIDNNEKNKIESNKVSELINEPKNKLVNCVMNATQTVTLNTTDYVASNDTHEPAISINGVTEVLTNETTIVLLKTIPTAKVPINIVNDENGIDRIPDTLAYFTDAPLKSKASNAAESKKYKWQQLKKVKVPGGKTKSVVKVIGNKTDTADDNKNKLHTKNIGRFTVTKKYNIVKILKHHKGPAISIVESRNNSVLQSDRKLGDVSNILGKLLQVYNNTKARKQPKKMRKFNVIKYLKKIFTNIFKNKNSAGRYARNHIIDTICEHFGPCRKNIKEKALLRFKLAQLDHETMSILKTVKIIKGLLRLIDGQSNTTSHTQKNFHSDIQKLHSILKDNYINDPKERLSQTELTQIEYIKRNAQDFVGSIGKFTILLHEIINILTKKPVDKSQNSKILNNNPNKEPFRSLKNLLIKYNLVQNNFMKRMYELLNSYNDKINMKPTPPTISDLNSTAQIEVLSRNIIKNLRKLKNLAQSMKSNGRTKREVKDDAIEYLLMLMEFLLKQNKPLDAAPDNDGIDLLIEAIRNAPDIKTVRKKVLDNPPLATLDNASLRMSSNSNADNSRSNSEDILTSINENPSNEDSGNLKIEYNEDILKPKADESKDIFDMADEDKDLFEKYQFDRRAGLSPQLAADATSEMPVYQKLDTTEFSTSVHTDETTTPSNLDIESNFRSDVINNINSEHRNIFNMNSDAGIIDSENNDNYNVGNGNLDGGKNHNNVNIFHNNAGNNNFEDNLETGNIEIGKNNIIGSMFNDNTGTLYDDNTENRNTDLGKSNNIGNIFNDNTENKNIDLAKTNSNGNMFDDRTVTKNMILRKNNNNGNIFDDNTENRNSELGKNENNVNIFNDNIEKENTVLKKNNNNAKTLFHSITENPNIDNSKNNNNDNIFNDNMDNKKLSSVKNNNNVNIFNDNTDIVSSYKPIPENGNNYNTIPENLNNYNTIPENANNYNIISEGGNSYNSIPENGNSYNSVPENGNSDNNIPESSNTHKPVTQKTTAAETNVRGKDAGIKKFQAIFSGDLDEDVAPLTAVDSETLKVTTESAGDWTKRPKSKTNKKIDLSDSDNSDKKSKLEWIVENFGRDDKIYEDEKDHEEKRDNIDHNTTKMFSAMPVKIDSTPKTPSTIEVSNVSNEINEPEKKKVPKINTEEVMLKKQMDLLNSLDYGTERGEFDESDSKDGNTDERYSDAFSAYFV